MKIRCTVDGCNRDYSATGNRPENSFTPIHPPIHPTPTRRTSQIRVVSGTLAIIGDTFKDCQAVKNETFVFKSRSQRSANRFQNNV